MTITFNKDNWIKVALKKRYLIAKEDGTIYRARKAFPNGDVDESKGYAKVIVQTHKPTGRVYFNMTYMGYTKAVLVNRIICIRFLPNPLNLPQVNHIDGVKAHNYLRQPTPELRAKYGEFQLEWSSASDNEKHAHRTGLKSGRGSANSNAKLTASDVVEIRQSADPAEELAQRYGVSKSTIRAVLDKRTWTHV